MSPRLLVLSSSLTLALVLSPAARAGDDLNKFVEQNRILAQKLKLETNAALAQARTLERTDPEQAHAVLQKALKQVQNSTALPASEQTQLIGQLLGRLRQIGETIRQGKVAQQQAPLKESPKKVTADPPAPGPSAVAQKFIEKGSTAADAAEKVRVEKNKGFSGAVAGIESSAIPPLGDVTFPKDWAYKTKLREKYSGPQLTPKEIALVKALNSVLTVEFSEKPLKEVLEYLQDRTGQPIIVDPGSLKEANTDYSDPVSFPKTKATFRTVLRKVLADNNLTYVIKEGMIQVVTPARARDMMVVCSYPISDLVAPSMLAQQFGPFVARAQMLANVQGLMNLIQTSIDPTIWQENGGRGSVTFHEPSMALIIRAPAEFHYQLAGGGLFGGR